MAKNVPDSGTYFLDDFLFALKSAIYRANQNSWLQHIHNLQRYFTQSGKDADRVLEPQTIKMMLPASEVGEDEAKLMPHDVPIATLVDHHSLTMSNLQLEFECYLEGLDEREESATDAVDTDEKSYDAVTLVLSPGKRNLPKAKFSIEYCNDQSPEGVARINDALLKYF